MRHYSIHEEYNDCVLNYTDRTEAHHCTIILCLCIICSLLWTNSAYGIQHIVSFQATPFFFQTFGVKCTVGFCLLLK